MLSQKPRFSEHHCRNALEGLKTGWESYRRVGRRIPGATRTGKGTASRSHPQRATWKLRWAAPTLPSGLSAHFVQYAGNLVPGPRSVQGTASLPGAQGRGCGVRVSGMACGRAPEHPQHRASSPTFSRELPDPFLSQRLSPAGAGSCARVPESPFRVLGLT